MVDLLRYLCQYLLSTTIWLNGILEICKLNDLQLSMRKKIFLFASSLDARCWLSKSSDPFPCSKQYYMFVCLSPFLPHVNSSISTWQVCTRHKQDFIPFSIDSMCLFHLIYVHVLSPPPQDFLFVCLFTFYHYIYLWVCVCTFMCISIYLFSCQSVPAPQLLILHCEYLVWCIVVVYQSYLLIVYALLGPWFG